jgi:virulence factor Mce-like protein
MTDVVAKLSAITCVALAIVAGAALYLTSNPGLKGTAVQAEFKDAYPLLPGMHVREYGAVAGTISEIEVTDRGTVQITMQLNEGTDPPRADATATIRQEDITGDSYIALAPGDAAEPLGNQTIPTRRTMSAPRFDDLLNSFNQPVRQGLKLILIQLGMSLERRGEDLNEAALRLRPALAATHRSLAEINSQNQALRSVIADAERVSGQAASRSRDLARLIDGLEATVQTTAAHAPALDAGIDNLPETLAATEKTLTRLDRLSIEARPLAFALRDAAPELATSARLLGPFVDDAGAMLGDVEPTIELTTKLLAASAPTIRANPQRVLTAPFDVASAIATLLDQIIGDETLLRGIFGADTYGGTEPGDFDDDVGFGAFTIERGNQLGYPADYDPLRRFARADAVPSCENFGVPIRPGCLADLIGGGGVPGASGARVGPDGRHPEAPADGGGQSTGEPDAAPASPPSGSSAPPAGAGGDAVDQAVEDLGIGDLLGQLGAPPQGAGGAPAQPGAAGDLLDFLLGR